MVNLDQITQIQNTPTMPNGEPLINLLLAATMKINGASHITRIRNLSADSAVIESEILLQEGASITLRRKELTASGIISWATDHRSGICFNEAINLKDWLPDQKSCGRARQPLRKALLAGQIIDRKSESPKPVQIPNLGQRIASEISFVQRKLAIFGENITDGHIVFTRHQNLLHELDQMSQLLGNIVNILSADEPNDTINNLNNEEMRRRLQQHRPL